MKKWLSELKGHMMTGVSLMIPLVVGAGLCYALSIVFGGPTVGSQEGTFWNFVNSVGSTGLGVIVPIVCVGVAYSIADKPGIAPAIIVGLIANNIGSGFLGGLVGGFLVGYFANWLKEQLLKTCRTRQQRSRSLGPV